MTTPTGQVSIRSSAFPKAYLRLDGRNISGTQKGGGGHVDCQSFVGVMEIFHLVPNTDGTVSIMSATYDNVFLRLDASSLDSKKATPVAGGGLVNAQWKADKFERFQLRPQDGATDIFAIESVRWPGVYLRMDALFTQPAPDSNDGGGGAGFGLVNASRSPSGPGPWEKFHITATTAPLTEAQVRAAIAKYGPVLKPHPDETFAMCSVDWFLARATLRDTQDLAHPLVAPTEAKLPRAGSPNDPTLVHRYQLTLPLEAKLGNWDSAKAYVHAFWESGMSVTDLQFWLFSAYNGPATALVKGVLFNKVIHDGGEVNLAPLGEHWGDWEYITIRIDNETGEAVGVYLSQHGTGHYFDLTTDAGRGAFQWVNGTHLVVYSSLNGHANYPSPGPNPMNHVQALTIDFVLLNSTADGGPISLDCSTRYELSAADFIPGFKKADWVGYPYRWGPEGTTINMSPKTAGDIVAEAAPWVRDVAVFDDVLKSVGVLLAEFVKRDINGATAPVSQGTWQGRY